MSRPDGSTVSTAADRWSFTDIEREAIEALESAYSPYSRFRVGAVLEAEDGSRFAGCNVENASYSVTICAERAALAAAITAGARSFRRIAVACSGSRPVSPCGMCRQALVEFGADLEVISVTPDGQRTAWQLDSLLPESFTPEELGKPGGVS